MDQWKELTDGSFKGYTFHVAIPKRGGSRGAVSIQTDMERRLQIIERAGVDGSDINDFGRKSEVIAAELVFHGDGYAEELAKFKQICNQGTAGLLIMPDRPDAIMAKYHKANFKSELGSGRTAIVSVVWIEDQASATKYEATAGPVNQSSEDFGTVSAKTVSAIDQAKNVISENTFLKAIESVETGISTARSTVNNALKISGEARGSILGVKERIEGNLDSIKSTIQRVQDFINSIRGSSTSSVSQAEEVSNGTVISDYTEPDDLPVPTDPLAKPPATDEGVVVPEVIQSEAVGENALSGIADSVKDDRDSLVDQSEGKVDDVAQALTQVVNLTKTLAKSIATKPTITVVVPYQMSLVEVMFHNDVYWDELLRVSRANTHLADTLCIPKDEVVYL